MKTTAISILVVGLLAGCAQQGGIVTSGAVTPGWENGPAVGLKAPQVKFTGADSKEHTLTLGLDRISIVGFVEPKGEECCMLSPVLAEAASRYWNKPVRVVQISLPTAECPHGAGCVESCHVPPLHVKALCDSDRVAYKAFGKPGNQTLLLLDGNGKVARVATMDQIKELFPQADKLVEEAEEKLVSGYRLADYYED